MIWRVLTSISGNTLGPVGRKHIAPMPNTWLPCPQEMRGKKCETTSTIGDSANQQTRLKVMNNSLTFPVIFFVWDVLGMKSPGNNGKRWFKEERAHWCHGCLNKQQLLQVNRGSSKAYLTLHSSVYTHWSLQGIMLLLFIISGSRWPSMAFPSTSSTETLANYHYIRIVCPCIAYCCPKKIIGSVSRECSCVQALNYRGWAKWNNSSAKFKKNK